MVMSLPGKPKGIDGGEVERYFHEGKIKEIADYCETDIVNTYRVWLRHELIRFGSCVSRARGLASIVPPPSARIGLLNEN